MLQKAFFLVLLLMIFSVGSVSAQDTTTATESATSVGESGSSRERFLQRREEARSNGSQIQSEAQLELDAQRQAFRQRLLQVQDTSKQKALERIDNKIQVTNQSVTDRFTDILEDLESINTRVESKAKELSTSGKDTQALEGAIADATSALSAAKAAVRVQSSKDYTIEIGSDETLKSQATQTVASFRTDISTLRDQIEEAKTDVVNAAKIAESI